MAQTLKVLLKLYISPQILPNPNLYAQVPCGNTTHFKLVFNRDNKVESTRILKISQVMTNQGMIGIASHWSLGPTTQQLEIF